MFVLYLCGIMVVCENQTKSSNNNLSGALNTNISVFVENTSTEPSGPLGFKTKRPEYKLASWLTFKVWVNSGNLFCYMQTFRQSDKPTSCQAYSKR